MSDILNELKLTREELINKLIDRIVESMNYDEREYIFEKSKEEALKYVNDECSRLAEQAFSDKIGSYIDEILIMKTNGFGEPKTIEKKTLIEYTTEFIENYLMQDVDWDGKEAKHSGRKRLQYMLDQKTKKDIDEAVRKVIHESNKLYADMIKESILSVIGQIQKRPAVIVRS